MMSPLSSLTRAIFLIGCTLGGMVPAVSNAQQSNPVVVELYTSQGCSSCPPADKLLHKLAKRDDVIALALHVDYWDYIGWKDAFALAEHAERQRSYARNAGHRSVYTPQMIINGTDSIVGARGMEVFEAIMAHKAKDTGVSVSLSRSGDTVTIRASARSAPGPMDVLLVRYKPEKDVKITRGENAGRHLTYSNIVEEWQFVTEWSGVEPLDVEVPMADGLPVAVLVQRKGLGPILAADKLR